MRVVKSLIDSLQMKIDNQSLKKKTLLTIRCPMITTIWKTVLKNMRIREKEMTMGIMKRRKMRMK